jgi:hypothetical protein
VILTGTPILLANGKTKIVEKLQRGDVLRGHDGRDARVLELVPLRSKKNILVVSGRHFLVMHHDQPVLTTYGWMRTRMLRANDQLVTFHQTGGGSAPVLWTDDQREWDGRLAKVDFRNLNIPPWPSPSLNRMARRSAVSSAHVRPILSDAFRRWTPIVERWNRLHAEEMRQIERWKRDGEKALARWREARDRWDRSHAGGTPPFPDPMPVAGKPPHTTTIAAFMAQEGLSRYEPSYFSNWCSKVRNLEETGGSSQPGFDVICGGGFVVPLGGDNAPLFIICRDGTPYEKPARVQEEDDEDEELSEREPVPCSTSKARATVSALPALSRRTTPSAVASLR